MYVCIYSLQFQYQAKNERDQFDELNRRLKMELQRVQQQTYSDRGLIKQLQDKLSQADNTEREWVTKYNREKDKVVEHCEKITVVENTVISLEKQTRDYVIEIEVWMVVDFYTAIYKMSHNENCIRVI
jgi:small-conductance mechanosensitive channel